MFLLTFEHIRFPNLVKDVKPVVAHFHSNDSNQHLSVFYTHTHTHIRVCDSN